MPRFSLSLLHKKNLGPQTWALVFQGPFLPNFRPGQFASLEFLPKIWRSYSLVEMSSQAPFWLNSAANTSLNLPELPETQAYWSFLISTRPGGLTSQFIENLVLASDLSKNPTETHSQEAPIFQALAPLGNFRLQDNNRPKNFICSGTGLAPFIPMILTHRQAFPSSPIKLFFGTSAKVGDYSRQFFSSISSTKEADLEKDNFVHYTCLREPDLGQNVQKTDTEFVYRGDLLALVREKVENWQEEEFYLCGNPSLTEQTKNLLQEQQAQFIFSESFKSGKG